MIQFTSRTQQIMQEFGYLLVSERSGRSGNPADGERGVWGLVGTGITPDGAVPV